MAKREVVVAHSNELANGEMKTVEAGGVKILLSRIDGTIYAVGGECSHYGADLSTGVLHGDRVVCPWHHACFCAKNGELLDPPARDSLPAYEVFEENGDIVLKLPDEPKTHCLPDLVVPRPGMDGRTFVIAGAGAAAGAAAQAMREAGFEGRIVMVTQEPYAPYNRTNLSKSYLAGTGKKEWLPLRGPDFYEKYGIEIVTGVEITGVDSGAEHLLLADRPALKYDRLLVATGSVPRTLDVPGNDLDGIYTLRSLDDCDAIIGALDDSMSVAVVGASFIGLETAWSFRERGKKVTVIAPEEVPFEALLGRDIGEMYRVMHQEHGVEFRLGHTVLSFTGNSSVTGVELNDGTVIKADLVLVGIGVRPATGFLDGVPRMEDGGLAVDGKFMVADSIHAAGDVAAVNDDRTGGRIRIEHWRTAEQQGRCAGFAMAGKPVRYTVVPFFWTTQYGIHLRYGGHAKDWDGMIVDGDIPSRDFIAYYTSGDKVVAAASMNRDVNMAVFEELMRDDRLPDADSVRDCPGCLVDLI